MAVEEAEKSDLSLESDVLQNLSMATATVTNDGETQTVRLPKEEILEPHEIVEVIDDLKAGRIPDPSKLLNGREPGDDELDDFEVLYDAEKILLVENATRLLSPPAN